MLALVTFGTTASLWRPSFGSLFPCGAIFTALFVALYAVLLRTDRRGPIVWRSTWAVPAVLGLVMMLDAHQTRSTGDLWTRWDSLKLDGSFPLTPDYAYRIGATLLTSSGVALAIGEAILWRRRAPDPRTTSPIGGEA